MANKKISEFNTATAADPTDLLLIQRGSGNFSLAIDTLNLSSALTVQDTGVDVETSVTNIDFVGGGVVVTSAGSGAVTVDVSAAGVSDWIDLSDTPVAYAGFAGYATRVNGGESGLEFFDFDPTVRGLISIAPGSSSHLGYDNSTGEISIKALGITSVTVNGSATSLANFVATFYTVGTEFQEGDTIILNGVPSGQEVYMHNGGTAVTVADFTLLEQPQVVTYTGLTDTPGTFAGDGNKFLRVNAGASAVEHVAASSINVGDFNDDGTYLTSFTETDPVFSASPAVGILAGDITNWDAAYTHSQVTTGNPHSVTKSDVGLGNVENTALSTWAGSSNITTLGTIGTGTWNASTIGETVGGTGQTTYATGDILYASAANTLSKLAAGTNTHVLTLVGGVPVWQAPAGADSGNILDTDALTLSTTKTHTITNGQALIFNSDGTEAFRIQAASANSEVSIANGRLNINYPAAPSNSWLAVRPQVAGTGIIALFQNFAGSTYLAAYESGSYIRLAESTSVECVIGNGANNLAKLYVVGDAGTGATPLRVDTNSVSNAFLVEADRQIAMNGVASDNFTHLSVHSAYIFAAKFLHPTDGVIVCQPTATTGTSEIQFRTGSGLGTYQASIQYRNPTNATNPDHMVMQGQAQLDVNSIINLTGGFQIKMNGAKVMGAQIGGWSAPTGVSSKAAFDPATVTTQELAQRVHALIDDCLTHGFIS